MRRYSFSVVGLFVLAVLVLVLSVLLRPRSEVTYGTGDHSFKAAFVIKPTVVIATHPNVALGGLNPETIRRVVTWRARDSSVRVAKVRGTATQLRRDLRATATMFQGTFRQRGPVSTVSFSTQVSAEGHAAPRYTEGLIELKGTTLFYARSASNSDARVARFIHDFRVVNF